MPDVRIGGSGDDGYPSDVESKLRVLEEIADGTKAILAEIAAIDQRRERDFRIPFGAIITTTLALAYLIARTVHWL